MGFGWLTQINGNVLISYKSVNLRGPRNLYNHTNPHKQVRDSKLPGLDLEIEAHYLSSDKKALGDITNE